MRGEELPRICQTNEETLTRPEFFTTRHGMAAGCEALMPALQSNDTSYGQDQQYYEQ
jgi:hypothetical protein